MEHGMAIRMRTVVALAGAALLAACGGEDTPAPAAAATAPAGTVVAVVDTTIAATFAASGTAQPLQQATLSSKLMGTVTEVTVHVGDLVRAGQVLARLDTRDLAARDAQVRAGIAGAEAAQREALQHATRIRALYADSAAPRMLLDQAEAGLARAEAGLAAARAQQAELAAVADYGVIRAPFAGRVTQRFVDPGAMAAPGAPLLAVEDASRLRISVSAAPAAAARLRAGSPVGATIEGRAVTATVEGAAPVMGNLYTVNALVANADGALPSGGAAQLLLPDGTRAALLVPAAAVVRQGDLVGVRVVTAGGSELRWVRLGAAAGDQVEVLSGIGKGDRVIVPAGER